MPTASQIQQTIDNLYADGAKLHTIINGTASETVPTENGPVKTVAGLQQEFELDASEALTGAENAAAAAASSEAAAAASASAAALSEDAVLALANLYPDTATGLAAVAEGAYFSVPGSAGTYAILYRKVGGAASEIQRYASKAAYDALVTEQGVLQTDINTRAKKSDLLATTSGLGLAMVSFKQLGTGAADRLALDKSREVFSVEDFRQPSDTDDADVAQRAVNAAIAAGGGTVEFQRRVYVFGHQVVVSGNGVHLTGKGRMATRISGSSSSVSPLKIMGYRCTVSHMQIDTASVGLHFHKATFCSGYELYFTSVSKPIQINGDFTVAPKLDCIQIKLHNIEMENFSVAGIHMYHCGDVFLSNVCTSGSNVTAIGLLIDSGTTAVYTINCNILACYDGLRIADDIGISPNPNAIIGRPGAMMFTNTLFDTCANRGANLMAAYQIKFVNSWAGGAQAEEGWLVGTNCSEIEWVGCHTLGNAKDGWRFVGPNSVGHFSIVGGHAYGNGFSASGVYDGVVIEPGVENFSITGLRAYNDTSMYIGATQRFGIYVFAGTSNHYIIAGNQLQGNLSGGLSDNGIGPDKQIYGNLPATSAGGILSASVTYDPSSMSADGVAVTTMTVTGARPGDQALVQHPSITAAGYFMSAFVTANDTVTVTILNKTGSVQNLPSGLMTAVVMRRAP